MKKELIIGIIVALIVGLVIGITIQGKDNTKLQQCYDDLNKYEKANSLDNMKICESICENKRLLSAGVGENKDSSVDTMQQSYDYTCNCLAQPMTICADEGDSACVEGIGYCDLDTRVCMPIKK